VRVPDEEASRAVLRNSEQLREELNVKSVVVLPRDAKFVTYRIKPNLPVVGKRYGKLIPAIRQALSQLAGNEVATKVARGETLTLEVAGQIVELEPGALLVETTAAEGFACAEDGGYLVGLDTTLTDELLLEGLARELVHTVQEARKQAGLEVSDRIVLDIEGNEAVMAALSAHRDYIGGETLVSRWGQPAHGAATAPVRHSLGTSWWAIRLDRATI
jgi:isoleucyl-tRNA synthetase